MNYKDINIEKAVEKKNKFITETQQNKENSIKTTAIQRDSVLIVTTFYPELANAEDKEKKIIEKLSEWKERFNEIYYQPF